MHTRGKTGLPGKSLVISSDTEPEDFEALADATIFDGSIEFANSLCDHSDLSGIVAALHTSLTNITEIRGFLMVSARCFPHLRICIHFHAHMFSLTHTHSLTLSLTRTLTHTHAHSHAHSHTLDCKPLLVFCRSTRIALITTAAFWLLVLGRLRMQTA